jgi:hypothetical protein
MEKLIELLKDQYWEVVTYNIQSDWGYMFHISWFAVREERLLSKKFWFIKWLVENEKIDLDKAKILDNWNKAELFEFIDRADYMKIRNRSYFSEYKQLLMLLSIQDEPIEFLVSILK